MARRKDLRLSAILMVDVAGYTTMIEKDSASTVKAWKVACEEIVHPAKLL